MFSILRSVFGLIDNHLRNEMMMRARAMPCGAGLAILFLALGGCQLPENAASQGARAVENKQNATPAEEFILQGGDTVRISFPGAQNLDTTQQIRSDGRISMPMLGEIMAAGKTPIALEKELIVQYAPQLVSKEVTVTVVASTFSVFVSGAVLRPGKVVTDRPISALEAIMEAGGFDSAKANTAAVVVIRQVGGKTQNFTLNLKDALEGKQIENFFLRRSDIVHVPEKFSWF